MIGMQRTKALSFVLLLGLTQAVAAQRQPDVIYVPTRQAVVDAMLTVAKVKAGDVVYDLGCGDGRIVVSAAKLGARGIGIDIDPQRVAEALTPRTRAIIAVHQMGMPCDLAGIVNIARRHDESRDGEENIDSRVSPTKDFGVEQ